MKTIQINYFHPDHISMLTSLVSRIPPGLADRIYAGYPVVCPVPTDPNVAIINVMNIMRDDVKKFGSAIEQNIMEYAEHIECYDFIKAMFEDDEQCVKCKLRHGIHMAMKDLFGVDEVTVTFFGNPESPFVSRSSTPRIIEDCLYDNFDVKSRICINPHTKYQYIIHRKEETK